MSDFNSLNDKELSCLKEAGDVLNSVLNKMKLDVNHGPMGLQSAALAQVAAQLSVDKFRSCVSATPEKFR